MQQLFWHLKAFGTSSVGKQNEHKGIEQEEKVMQSEQGWTGSGSNVVHIFAF